jgi:hypothetical protein
MVARQTASVRSSSVILLLLIVFIICDQARGQYVAGQSSFGRNNYVEYIAGNGPLIISAPHGGSLEPGEIPDRTGNVTTSMDLNTQELARDIQVAYHKQTGWYPHVIMNCLHRKKLDANREIVEAAQGNVYAVQAWNEFQTYIDTAAAVVTRQFGGGFYVDLHGHGHTIQRLELGYLLTGSMLSLSNSVLNSPYYASVSSIRSYTSNTLLTFSELLRGEGSLGSFFEYKGYSAVPSILQPSLGAGDPYFDGGYNVDRHGSAHGGTISGVQIECNYSGVRDTDPHRKAFAATLVDIVVPYMNRFCFQRNVSDASIVLNEVMFDVPIDDTQTAAIEGDANGDGIRSVRGDEFVEVMNTGSVDADIGGYQILEKNFVPIYTFPASTTLIPGEVTVVFGGVGTAGFGSPFPPGLQLFAAHPAEADSGFYVSNSKTNFLGTGDNIILLNPATNHVADEVCWGTNGPNTKYGKKLVAPNTLAGDSIAGTLQQSITRTPAGSGLWAKHLSVSTAPYSPGAAVPTAVHHPVKRITPDRIELAQNFPNPFNPETIISFSLLERTNVRLTVYDDIGREVALLTNGLYEAGTHSVKFLAATKTGRLASGVYLYRIETTQYSLTRSMVLLQ